MRYLVQRQIHTRQPYWPQCCLILLAALWSTYAPGALADSATATAAQSATPPGPQRPVLQREEDPGTSRGCVSCHTVTDQPTMHASPAVTLGCTDCHGGNATISVASGAAPGSAEYRQAMQSAHVIPRDKQAWHYPSSAN